MGHFGRDRRAPSAGGRGGRARDRRRAAEGSASDEAESSGEPRRGAEQAGRNWTECWQPTAEGSASDEAESSGKPRRGAERDHERGAALVEFALIAPIFFMLVLAMFTGGISYDRKQSVTSATREAARYAATLPITNFATTDAWLDDVATVAVASAEDNLQPTAPNRLLCVAYIPASGTPRSRSQVGAGSPTYSSTSCFSDGRPAGEGRVQVVAERTSDLEALFFTQTLRLRGQAVARYEAG